MKAEKRFLVRPPRSLSPTAQGARLWWSLPLVFMCLSCDLQQDLSLERQPEQGPAQGPSVLVEWDTHSVEVELALLDQVLVDGKPVCLLWDILAAAGLKDSEILSMRFDFESRDGYRPSSKQGCEPLVGENLAYGYLDPGTLAIEWDASLGLRGCYWVKDTARILGEPS